MISSTAKDENIRNLKDNVYAAADEAKGDLRATAANVGRRARDFLDTASDEMSHVTKTVSDHVHHKPVQSTLIALGVGLVLGALLRR